MNNNDCEHEVDYCEEHCRYGPDYVKGEKRFFYVFTLEDREKTFQVFGITGNHITRFDHYKRSLEKIKTSVSFSSFRYLKLPDAEPEYVEKAFKSTHGFYPGSKSREVGASTCGVDGTIVESFLIDDSRGSVEALADLQERWEAMKTKATEQGKIDFYKTTNIHT